jgi:hypothetical protein
VIRGARYLERYDLRRSGSVCSLRWLQNHFFSVPTTATPMVQGNVVAELIIDSTVPVAAMSIVGSPMIEFDEKVEPIF